MRRFSSTLLRRLALAGLILWIVPPLAAEQWPQWRGPSGNGVSTATGLPTDWSTSKNVAWQATLAGLGTSSPVVWNDRIFVTSQTGNANVRGGSHPHLARDDQTLAEREDALGQRAGAASTAAGDDVFLVVEAFQASDGSRVWAHRTKATGEMPELHEKHNLATPTPVTDGERIYAWFGNGQLVVLDMDGTLIWARHIGEEYAPFHNRWGHGSSPALHQNLLILLCDHLEVGFILALDKRTGEERWNVDRGEGRVSHSTPAIVPGPDGDEMIVNSSERVDVFNPSTGELLWHTGSERQTPIPTPVFSAGVIYMARGYRNSDVLALRPGARGELLADDYIWRASGGASYVPSIIQYDGLVYITNEIGVVSCLDAKTGERIWRQRLRGIFFASPTAGDGKVYLASETGEVFVLRAGREAEILATNDIGERLIASPAISGRRILLRSDGKLFAIGD